MKNSIIAILIILSGCEVKEKEAQETYPGLEEKPMLSPNELKQWTIDSICKVRKHVWNQITIGESEPKFNQTLIDYKDSTVLFNEKIRIEWFDCIRCKKKIYTNDTTITDRIRVLPPVEFIPDTSQMVYFMPENYIFTPRPPIKR